LADEDALKRFFVDMDEDAEPRRVFRIEGASHDDLQRLVDLDDESEVVLVATHCPGGREEIVGAGEYRVDGATHLATVALAVRPDFRLMGLGTAFVRRIIELGRARGLAGLTATVRRDNHPMLDIFHKCGLPIESRLQDDGKLVRVVASLSPVHEPSGQGDRDDPRDA
jgi:GNAT superfamily N-acetyltransferase